MQFFQPQSWTFSFSDSKATLESLMSVHMSFHMPVCPYGTYLWPLLVFQILISLIYWSFISPYLRSHDISVPRSIDQSNFKAFLLVSEQKTLFYKSMLVSNYFAMLCWIFNLCKISEKWLAGCKSLVEVSVCLMLHRLTIKQNMEGRPIN